MQEKYGFVYIWRDRKHKRFYIGSHWGHEDDGYICSSTWMNNSYKRRPNDFQRRIISRIYSNKSDLLIEENVWLKMISNDQLGKRYYNLRNKDFGHWSTDQDLSLSIKEKISIKTKEAMARPEVRDKIDAAAKIRNTKSSNLEVRAKRSLSMKIKMAEKFPIENRHKQLSSEARTEYYSNKAKENWDKPGFKEKTGKSISESLKASKEHRSKTMSSLKWYNDGLINIRRKEHPGEEWSVGRLKYK